MNFISHLLASKGDRGSAEHPVAAGPFPAAHKNSSTTASPEPSPPASPRFKSPPPAAASSTTPSSAISPRGRQPTAEDTHHLQQHGAPPLAVPATSAGHDGEVEKLVKGLRAQLHALKKERAAQDARYVALASKHQEDKELHEASLDQLRQHMAHMNDSLALLREDRELLNRDVLVEREANKKLTEENDQLKIHQGELSKHHKELEDQLATMAASELTARNFAANTRSIEDAQTDAAFRQRFNLPATEFPIISYYCCHKHIYHGWLYITPAYMCFEPALLSKESARITTPLTSITTLAKVRGFKYIPGTDNALIFKLKSGVEYFFNNFTHRDSVIANLVHQAAKFGHRIQSQDEKQIPDEGKEPKRGSDGVVPPAGLGSLGQSKDTDSLPRPSSNSFDHGNVSLPRVSNQRARSLSDVG